MPYIIILLYIFISIGYMLKEYKKYYISPSLIFVFFQLIMFLGIVFLFDNKSISDWKLIFLYFIALITFIIGDILFANRENRIKYYKIEEKLELRENKKIRMLVIVSISLIICFMFFSRTQNVFFLTIESILKGNVQDYSELRKEINFTEGSGYIYALRVYIIPFITFYFLFCEKNKMIGLILLPFSIIFLLASGQRGGFIYITITIILFIMMNNKYGKNIQLLKIKKLRIILLFSIIVFLAFTIANGRQTVSGSLFSATIDRLFKDNQYCAIIAFKFINIQPIQWGKDWLNMFVSILPGNHTYIPLATLVFSFIYGGSLAGTSPPCIWGSVYYNWGIAGVAIIPFILGICYKRLYFSLFSKPLSKYRVFYYAFLFYTAGSWMLDSPMFFLNDGFIIIVLLNIMITFSVEKNSVFKLNEKSDY